MIQPLFALLTLCLLAPLHAVISATTHAAHAGLVWGLGNRSIEPEFPLWARRLARSHANLIENLPSFIGVVLIGHILHRFDAVSGLAAWGFVAFRIAFAVVYTAGITFLSLRTVLYFASLGCLGGLAWQITHATLF